MPTDPLSRRGRLWRRCAARTPNGGPGRLQRMVRHGKSLLLSLTFFCFHGLARAFTRSLARLTAKLLSTEEAYNCAETNLRKVEKTHYNLFK